jgi:hypothetical protein
VFFPLGSSPFIATIVRPEGGHFSRKSFRSKEENTEADREPAVRTQDGLLFPSYQLPNSASSNHAFSEFLLGRCLS